ncbi:MAG: ASPIC/UnbV domain-containing protein [Planctomycetota bacterium]
MSQGATPVSAGPTGGDAGGPALYDLIRRGRSFSGHEQNCCFLNLGDGRFADISATSGFNFADDGRALARVDWDLDGDLDFWIANRNGPQLRLLLNRMPQQGASVSFLLEGIDCNRDAIGARVRVKTVDHEVPLMRTVRAGDGFLAQSSKRIHVGLGEAAIESVTVDWPGGESEVFADIEAGNHYRLRQGDGRGVVEPARPPITLAAATGHAPDSHATSIAGTSQALLTSQLPLPPLAYQTIEGETRRLGLEKGVPKLINLWASWCQPCAAELSEWTRRADLFQQAGLEVVALSVDGVDRQRGSVTQAAAMLDRIAFPFTAGWATTDTVEQLQTVHDHLFDAHHPLPVPSSLLIDPQGQVAALYRGPVSAETVVNDLRRSQLPLKPRVLESTPFAGRWHFHRLRLNPHDLVWKWLERGWIAEALRYLSDHNDSLAAHHHHHKLLVFAGNQVVAQGNVPQAMAFYRRALAIAPNDPDAHNNLAWLLATHADPEIRDPAGALRHALNADEQKPDDPSVLDTLAAAYAANGRVADALATVTRALQLAEAAGDEPLAEQIRQQMIQLKAEQP